VLRPMETRSKTRAGPVSRPEPNQVSDTPENSSPRLSTDSSLNLTVMDDGVASRV